MKHAAENSYQPTLLVILDGFGVNPSKQNNAILQASTPNFDRYFASYPHTTLQASGPAVGLPDGQMGNSEVGHITLGCGSIIKQDLVVIDDAIADGSFYSNPVLVSSITRVSRSRGNLHLLGLVSDGGVHSHLNHLLALIRLCKKHRVQPYLHMITDGRDTAPHSALTFLAMIQPALDDAGGHIASIMGRYYAMDRDNRWERTELAWRALLLGKGVHATSATAGIEAAYANGVSDEFIQPILLPCFDHLRADDELIMFNFRKDRPQQIVKALASRQFSAFDRTDYPTISVSCLMSYNLQENIPYAFEPQQAEMTIGNLVSRAGLKQFHCAETEKYPHVTYFFNGGKTEPYPGEERTLIPSPKVSTYDLKPEMNAEAVANATIEAIQSNSYGFIVVNFANGDMVGHTAIEHAAIQAVETLDREAGRVIEAAIAANYAVVLTADHGNCEELVDPNTGAPHTQHTCYPVPCLLISENHWQLSSSGGIANIAPTILQLIGLEQPPEMTATSLLLTAKHDTKTPALYRGAA